MRLAYSTVRAFSKRTSNSSGQRIGFSAESVDEVVGWWMFGDRFAANIALNVLAQAAWMSGEHRRADHYFREALALAHEMRDRMDSAYCIQGLAATARARDEPQRAARMLGSANALLENTGAPIRATADRGLYQRPASGARERLGEQAWIAAWDEGQAMTFDEAVAYALADDETLSATP